MINTRFLGIAAVVIVFAQQMIGQDIALSVTNVQVSECRKGSASKGSARSFFVINTDMALDARNTSTDAVLLFKDLGLVSEVKAARTKADALAGRYLFTIQYDMFPSTQDVDSKGPNLAQFVVLQPGGTYDTKSPGSLLELPMPRDVAACSVQADIGFN